MVVTVSTGLALFATGYCLLWHNATAMIALGAACMALGTVVMLTKTNNN